MNTARAAVAAVATTTALAIVGALAWRPTGIRPVNSVMQPLAAVRLAAGGAAAVRLGGRMVDDDAFADDVVFLFIAALRGRCTPDRAHDLPRMAVVAGLPVLSGGDETKGIDAPERRDVRDVVHDLVGHATCGRALDLHVGSYRVIVDPDAYAAAFPDSFFDPALATMPDEYDDVSLAQRADDPCSHVAYAVLPLDAARPWQCAGLRAGARKRIRMLCRTQSADAAANPIRAAAESLPPSCQ